MARVGGRKVIVQRLAIIRRNVLAELQDELDDQAQDLLEESQRRAPQLTGALVLTAGTDSEDNRASGRLRRTVFYREEYAIYQHEGYFNPGPISTEKLGGSFAIGRKYLQRPFDELAPGFKKRSAVAVERALRLTLR